MSTAPQRRTRRFHRLAACRQATSAVAVLGVAFAHGCVISDPPGDLPHLPSMRPTIVRASVVPPPSQVLGRWPDRFIVPVELADPRSTIWWSAFVDYNPDTGFGLDGLPTQSTYEPATTQGRVRMLEIPIGAPASLDRCHLVEVVVALNLNTRDSKNAHTPDEPGGDIVSWFYSPSGDLAGCPVLDAGIPPPLAPDAEAVP